MGEKKGFFKRLVSGLAKTRDNIVSGIDSIFNGFSSIDEDFYEELEEILIMGDLGIHARSSTNVVSIVISSGFTFNTSTIISCNFSNSIT